MEHLEESKRGRDNARRRLMLNLLDAGRPGTNIKIKVEDMVRH